MSPQWVYKHAELGTLPCVRLGAALRFRPDAIRRYLESLERRRVVSFPTAPIHNPK
ncbi:MAG: helix-turn-helix domain-containing protein [Myxococcaceae bacterium]|nr:helix-turn-helix domain-containing protein [Myxococcaceae bacterium]